MINRHHFVKRYFDVTVEMKEHARIAVDADLVGKILWFPLRVDVNDGVFKDVTYQDVSFGVMDEGQHLRVISTSAD